MILPPRATILCAALLFAVPVPLRAGVKQVLFDGGWFRTVLLDSGAKAMQMRNTSFRRGNTRVAVIAAIHLGTPGYKAAIHRYLERHRFDLVSRQDGTRCHDQERIGYRWSCPRVPIRIGPERSASAKAEESRLGSCPGRDRTLGTWLVNGQLLIYFTNHKEVLLAAQTTLNFPRPGRFPRLGMLQTPWLAVLLVCAAGLPTLAQPAPASAAQPQPPAPLPTLAELFAIVHAHPDVILAQEALNQAGVAVDQASAAKFQAITTALAVSHPEALLIDAFVIPLTMDQEQTLLQAPAYVQAVNAYNQARTTQVQAQGEWDIAIEQSLQLQIFHLLQQGHTIQAIEAVIYG